MNTTYFLNCVAGNIFKSTDADALPTSLYIGLSTTAPSADGTGVTEPSDSEYSRVQLVNMSVPEDGCVKNNGAISFNESGESWGTITHYVICDAVTGGNVLMYGPLTVSRTVEAATVMTIREGQLKLSALNPA